VRPDTTDSTEPIGRRKYLALSALAVVGVAGCSSERVGRGAKPTNEESSDMSSPTAATQSFYTTLYAGNDLEGANGMFHPESPAPELKPANFERFGGLENMGTDVQSTDVVSQGNGQARVHAEVIYSTAEGQMGSTLTDYVFLKQHDGEWLIDRWAPERIRRIQAKGAVEKFYGTLYGKNDIEAANAMYHPESESPALQPSAFEPDGGIQNIRADIQSLTVLTEGGGEAEVRAEVEYTTPDGVSTATDRVFLASHRGRWRIDEWVSEATGESGEAGDN